MKAIVQEKYGSPDDLELREVERPRVGDDEVLVQIRAASLHPDVWHVVTGRPYVLRLMGGGFSKPKNPIPGTDMAGIVESVGKNVTRFRRGDAVFGETIDAHQWTNGGAFAEYVSARQEWLALKPDNVSFEQAASVPTSGFITLLNLRGGSLIRPGQRVLVNGAGGGVGSLALQVAKAYGAHVTGVDTTSKLSMLRSLGADEVIDYTEEDFTRRGVRYDFILDVPGNNSFSACRRALERHGKYVLIGHEKFGASGKRFLGLLPRFIRLIFLSLFVKQLRLGRSSVPSREEAMTILRDLLADGKVTPIIDSTYPLSETRAALRHLVEDEVRGKVIITVGATVSQESRS
ncbi:MAG: NAD(P)-dependent alcohol dehydrogenase [Gemmatimonadales bacterium]|jgi:NADPH:quinone reductase-like Zn-dependent oxidoreductase